MILPGSGPTAPSARGRAVVVRDHSGALPAWTPPAPEDPEHALDLAEDYADEHAARLGTTPRKLALVAYAALVGAYPGVKRAEVFDRLRGRDAVVERFGEEAEAEEPEDSQPPF